MRETMEGDDPRARILAANTVLDRGYGKATKPTVAEGVDASLAHLDALRRLSAKRVPADTAPPIAAPLADDGEKPPVGKIN
jgi:hypothetical protein